VLKRQQPIKATLSTLNPATDINTARKRQMIIPKKSDFFFARSKKATITLIANMKFSNNHYLSVI